MEDNVSEWSNMSTMKCCFSGIRIMCQSGATCLYDNVSECSQWNQDNVSEWSNMSTYEVLFQWNQDNVSEWSNMSTYEVCQWAT